MGSRKRERIGHYKREALRQSAQRALITALACFDAEPEGDPIRMAIVNTGIALLRLCQLDPCASERAAMLVNTYKDARHAR